MFQICNSFTMTLFNNVDFQRIERIDFFITHNVQHAIALLEIR